MCAVFYWTKRRSYTLYTALDYFKPMGLNLVGHLPSAASSFPGTFLTSRVCCFADWGSVFSHTYRAARVDCVNGQRRQNSPWWFWLGLPAVYKSSQIYWLAGRSLRPPNTAPSRTTAFSERSRLQQNTQRKRGGENKWINSGPSGRAGLKRKMQREWVTRESGARSADRRRKDREGRRFFNTLQNDGRLGRWVGRGGGTEGGGCEKRERSWNAYK